MVTFAVATTAVLAFTFAALASRPMPVVRALTRAALTGVTAMFDPELDDLHKERALRRAGFALIRSAVQLLVRVVIALGAAAVVLVVADRAGLTSTDRSVEMILSIEFIVTLTVVAVVANAILRRRRRGRPSDAVTEAHADHAHNDADQLVHQLFFASSAVVRGAGRLDSWLFSRSVAKVQAMPPVFIVSLARGGTTALLNALHKVPAVAAHEYRDMPFVTAPVLWERLGGDRSTQVARRPRAHGDGLEIGLDSPEAFDEVLWRAYWPEKYRADRIDLWRTGDIDPKHTRVFERHHARVTLLRCGDLARNTPCRYVSKNNANVARLPVLTQMFPHCSLVIALRRPSAHAASLLRQHENFLRLHEEDPFTRRYMRDIGHLEFGDLHQPIAFPGFPPEGLGPRDPDYWLAYWIAAFEEIRASRERCHVVLQDDLRRDPQTTMEELCAHLDLDATGVDFTGEFRPGRDVGPDERFSASLLERAEALYADLASNAGRLAD